MKNYFFSNYTKAFLSILFLISLSSTNVIASNAIININTATAEEISKSLKGVGIEKATAIVEYRKKHGDFLSAQELEMVKGIGKKTIEKNSKKISYKKSKK